MIFPLNRVQYDIFPYKPTDAMNVWTVLYLLAGSVCLIGFALQSPPDESARIVLTPENDTVHIQGVFENTEELSGTLTYALDVVREGASGTSSSAQSGSFETDPGQVDSLSTSRVNVSEGDRLEVDLTIEHNGERVARASIDCVYPDCHSPESTNER